MSPRFHGAFVDELFGSFDRRLIVSAVEIST
jgi:hypothetical protein